MLSEVLIILKVQTLLFTGGVLCVWFTGLQYRGRDTDVHFVVSTDL